jgi:hypothetical protein
MFECSRAISFDNTTIHAGKEDVEDGDDGGFFDIASTVSWIVDNAINNFGRRADNMQLLNLGSNYCSIQSHMT